MDFFPALPSLPADQHARVKGRLRYEDICQDGRMTVLGLPHTTGPAVWETLLARHPVNTAAMRHGVIPILSRLIVQGGGGPLSVARAIELEGAFQLAHSTDGHGSVDRLFMNFWVEASGPAGHHRHGVLPVGGEKVFAGRVFAEHVFTRLFAPPEERKVTRLEFEGLPEVPPDRYTWRPHATVLELPAGAEPLDDRLIADDALLVFGLCHTDSNQHVNSLVYPRLFEEAALRRLAARGVNAPLLSRYAEVAYRKPCFAGQRFRIVQQAFRLEDRYGVVGGYVPDGPEGSMQSGSAPLNCYLRMMFTG